MQILVTGAKGFIGKNLVAQLKTKDHIKVYEYDVDSHPTSLEEACQVVDFVFHLAGVNRPQENSEFMEGNFGFTSILLDTLKKYKNLCPVMISSSIQAKLTNEYGKSKKAGEDLLLKYSVETGAKVFIYRFPNVFGKGCRPHYNSAVATFCYQLARDLPITVNDPRAEMNLVYIDDVIEELIGTLQMMETQASGFYPIPVVYQVSLGEIVELIHSFRQSRKELSIPNLADSFTKKLYSTYLSYLPEDGFSYDLTMHVDNRGSFTEFIRTPDRGQVSVNISKPGITKGNHWHHTKNEKFLVVSGRGVIRFRKLDSKEIIEYFVSGDKLQVVDIPVGYTHHIENLGDVEMVTLMWVNEAFKSEEPDTYFLEV